MKKYILVTLLIFIIGCSNSYHKHREVEESYSAGEPKYTIWIISEAGFIGLGKVKWNKVCELPINQMTENSIDSMDKIADGVILKLKKIEKEIKKH